MDTRGNQPVQTLSPDVSRRGALCRAGLATAAGAAALIAVDKGRADAGTGDPLVLGRANDADDTTELSATPSTNPDPLLRITGPAGSTPLSVSVASSDTVSGSAISAGGGKDATGVSASSETGVGVSGGSVSGTGVAGGSSAGGIGVRGMSISGTGVVGSSTSGVGMRASTTNGTALSVNGKVHFSRSGAASVAQGTRTKTVNIAGMTASSLVLVTLQKTVNGVYLEGAIPGSGKFTVRLSKTAPTAIRFAWFVVSG
ncbi:MAG TPA: hypothetical protein VE441_02175 [Mycobacterium sp.]|jgi:hypothetical protein|nr:hypothetical protein [Mycobacterium sp.]